MGGNCSDYFSLNIYLVDMGKIQMIRPSQTLVNTKKLYFGCTLEVITFVFDVQQFPNHTMECDFLLENPTDYRNVGIKHRVY